MANTLRFKRGLVATIPTALAGEPLFTTDTFDLYIGNGTTNTRFQKYIASGTTSQLLRGDGSLLTMPIVLTSPSNGQVLKFNGTNWVNDSDAGVTGTGTTNYLPKWTSGSALGNSAITDDGTTVSLVSRALSGTSGTFTGNMNADDYNMAAWKILDWNGGVAQIGGISASQWTQLDLYTGGSIRASLTSTGLGIGTTSPAYKLDVQNGSDFDIRLKDTSLGGTVGILFETQNDFSGTSQAYIKGIGSGNSGRSQLIFGTATNVGDTTASEKMRLDASGNLGLGVVPSAWSSIFNVIEGPRGSVIAFQNNGNSLKLGSNFYFTGANYNYINTNAAARYDADAEHRWYLAPSGTAGNAISFTQAMTLDASGRLGIGTSSPSERLDVFGTGDIKAIIQSSSSGSGANCGIVVKTSTEGHWLMQTGNAVSGGLRFYDSSTSTERLRITSGGNLLVGTTTDSGYKLDVNGGIYGKGITADSNGGVGNALYAYNQVLSGSSTNALIQLATTWNTTGNANAIDLNVTNTASGASSNLMNLRVDLTSMFRVSKGGAITTAAPAGYAAKPYKLGEVLTNAATANRSIAVEIDGTVYFLLASTTAP